MKKKAGWFDLPGVRGSVAPSGTFVGTGIGVEGGNGGNAASYSLVFLLPMAPIPAAFGVESFSNRLIYLVLYRYENTHTFFPSQSKAVSNLFSCENFFRFSTLLFL